MEKAQKEIIVQFRRLTSKQQVAVLEELGEVVSPDTDYLHSIQESNRERGLCCSHCGSSQVIGWGKRNGLQRYRCKECKRTFNSLTGTSLSHLKKRHLLKQYLPLMEKNATIADIVEEMGISCKTALDWRHKLYSAIAKPSSKQLQGIIEVDETFFLHSGKGSRKLSREARRRGGKAKKRGISNEQVTVLVSGDRRKNFDGSVSNLGRITKEDVGKFLGPKLTKDNIICSDSHKSIEAYVNDLSLTHFKINAGKKEHVKDKIYHVQNVNSFDSRLKNLIYGKFKGVASKNLQSYITWFLFWDRNKGANDLRQQLLKDLVENDRARIIYQNIPYKYELLMTSRN